MPQDGAAVAQVGADVEQVVAFVADIALPEGHDLHQAFGAHVAHGVLAEGAFHFNQPQHHLRVEVGAGGFVLNHGEQAAAVEFVVDEAGEPCGHFVEPALRVCGAVEHQIGRAGVFYGLAHDAGHVVGKRFFALRAGLRQCGREQQQAAGAEELSACKHGVGRYKQLAKAACTWKFAVQAALVGRN